MNTLTSDRYRNAASAVLGLEEVPSTSTTNRAAAHLVSHHHDPGNCCSLLQLKVKEEKLEEDDKTNAGECAAAVKEEDEEVKCSSLSDPGGGGAAGEEELGRLVMTVDGQQKQLPFGPIDLLSRATMLIGDKVNVGVEAPQSFYSCSYKAQLKQTPVFDV